MKRLAAALLFSIFAAAPLKAASTGTDFGKLISILNPITSRPDYINNISSVNLGNLFGVSTKTVTGSEASDGDVLTFKSWSTSGTWIAKTPSGGSGGGGGSLKSFIDSASGVSLTSMNFLSSQITRTTAGSSATFVLNPTSVTMQGNAITISTVASGLQAFIPAINISTSSLFTALNSTAVSMSNYFTATNSTISALSLSTASVLSVLKTTATALSGLQASIANGIFSIYDEGILAAGNATALNFVGSGVSALASGSTITVTVSGGSGTSNALFLMPAGITVSTLNFPSSNFRILSDGAGGSTVTWRDSTGTITAPQIFNSTSIFMMPISIGTGTGGLLTLSTTSDFRGMAFNISTGSQNLFEIWGTSMTSMVPLKVSGQLTAALGVFGPTLVGGLFSPNGSISDANTIAKFCSDSGCQTGFYIRRGAGGNGSQSGPLVLSSFGSSSRGLQFLVPTGGTTVGEPGQIIITTAANVNIGGVDQDITKFHVSGGAASFMTPLGFYVGQTTSSAFVFFSSNVIRGHSIVSFSSNPNNLPVTYDFTTDSVTLHGVSLVIDSGVMVLSGNQVIFQSTPFASGDNVLHINGNRAFVGGQSSGYSGVQDEGSNLVQRSTLNFIGASVSCVDNSGAGSTDCTFTASGGGGASSALYIEPYGVSVTTMFFPRSEFQFFNGSGISTVTVRGATGTFTAAQTFNSTQTFNALVNFSSWTTFTSSVSITGAWIPVFSSYSLLNIAGSTFNISPTGQVSIGTLPASSLLDIFNGSITVRGANAGIQIGGVSFTNYMSTVATDINSRLLKSDFNISNATAMTKAASHDLIFSTITLRLDAVQVDSTALRLAFETFKTTADPQLRDVKLATGSLRPDNLGSHVSTMTLTLPFGATISSGTFQSSVTIFGLLTTSSGALLGATTIQGPLLLEGATLQFRNGANEFSINFASGGWTVGQRLIVTQVSGSRYVIGTGAANAGTGGGGSGNFATLQSPATGPYNQNNVGALINSTGVYLSSGSLVVGASTPTGQADITLYSSSSLQSHFYLRASSGEPWGDYEFQPASATFNVSTVTITGVLLVGPAGGGNNVFIGSATITTGGNGSAGGGVSAATYTVNGDNIFYSTQNARIYDGYIMAIGSFTAIPTGGTLVVAAPTGFSSILMPQVTEIAADAESNQINISAITGTSFTIKNKSAINTKSGVWSVLMRR